MTDLASLPGYVRTYSQEAHAAFDAPYLLEAMQKIVPIFLKARSEDRTIFTFGNGGSGSNASHFVTDIAKVAAGANSAFLHCGP